MQKSVNKKPAVIEHRALRGGMQLVAGYGRLAARCRD